MEFEFTPKEVEEINQVQPLTEQDKLAILGEHIRDLEKCIRERDAEIAALRAVLAPLYSRFEDDEEGCAECHCCPVCCIDGVTQFKYGVSHYEGCKLAEVMRDKRPIEDVLRSIVAEVPKSEWDKLPKGLTNEKEES